MPRKKYSQADFILGGWEEVPAKHARFKPFFANSHKAAQAHLAGMLSVDGARGLVATTDDGALVGSSLYEDGDFIVGAPRRKKKK